MSGSSDYTRTSNLGLFKPNYNMDYGNWGGHLNQNSDMLDSIITGIGHPPSAATTLPLMDGTAAVGTGTPYARADHVHPAPWFNVQTYGAVGDGTTNDTAAVQAAFAAAAAGGEVYFPRGTYVLSSTISQAVTGSITVRGAGRGVTVLNCASNGIALTLAANQRGTIADLTIASTAAGTVNTGLLVASPDQTAAVRVQNVVLRGNTARTTAWQTAISLAGPGLPIIDGVTVLMPDGTQVAGPTGILFAGADSGHPTSGLAISNSFLQGGQYGVRIGPYVEGVMLTNATIIGGDYSVYWPHTAGASNMLEVANCHFNPGTCGVYAQQVGFISVVSTFFLRFNGPNWTAIDLESCNNIAISANNIYGTGAGTENGIIVNGSSNAPVAISGNAFLQLGTAAITLSGNTSAATITGNNAGSMPGGAVLVRDTTGNTRTNQAIGNSFNGSPDINANRNGIAYSGLAGGSNAIGFAWNGTVVHAYVDGTDEGGLLPTYGGTIQPAGPLTGNSATALIITDTAAGSGTNGPATAQFGLSVSHVKQDWNDPTQSNVHAGEIDGIYVYCRQGGSNSDCGAVLVNAQSTGLSYLAMLEGTASIVNVSTSAITKQLGVTLGALDGVGNTAQGIVVTSNTGSLNTAIQVQDTTGAGTWTNVLTNTRAGSTNFILDSSGNITNSGTINSNGNITTAGVVISNGLHGQLYLRSDTAVSLLWDGATGGIQFNIGGNTAEILNSGALTIFGTKVVGTQIAGWGTPTGGARTASFNGASATLAQTSAVLAQLILDLKTHGLLGA